MKKKATIVDIANKLGITPSAVSKAFSNHPRISEKTKSAVLKTAEQIGYQRNALASGLRNGKSELIGVIVPGIHFNFFATAIKGIEETLTKKGYNVIITQSHDKYEDEKRQIEGLLRAQVEGVMASLAIETKQSDHFKKLINQVPVVLFDRTFEDIGASTVTIDDYQGATIAVSHLVEKGYTKIAHIGGYSSISAFRKRIEGFKDALQKYGLSIREEYIHQAKPNENEGSRIANELLNLSDPPNAIFAASDFLALGAIRTLKLRGIKVPDQFGVVGFSNEPFSSQVSPSITTIDQHSEMMGVMAAKSMIDQLQFLAEGRDFVSQKQILTPKLIVRESSSR
jgi:LacI family transcriptional regulator